MRLLLLILFFSTFIQGCKKDNGEDGSIQDITGHEWRIYGVQEVNDPFVNPIPTDWMLKLEHNRSFVIDLGNTITLGSYTWTTTDSFSADVLFDIPQWNNPSQSAALGTKLHTIIQSVDKVYIYRMPTNIPFPAPPLQASIILEFEGSAGYFYVYR